MTKGEESLVRAEPTELGVLVSLGVLKLARRRHCCRYELATNEPELYPAHVSTRSASSQLSATHSSSQQFWKLSAHSHLVAPS